MIVSQEYTGKLRLRNKMMNNPCQKWFEEETKEEYIITTKSKDGHTLTQVNHNYVGWLEAKLMETYTNKERK